MTIAIIILAVIIGVSISMSMKSSGKTENVGVFKTYSSDIDGRRFCVLEKCNTTDIKSVIIPDNITTIGAESFKGFFMLSDISFGKNTETIGSKAFEGCLSLENVIISNSIKKINDMAFKSCKSLNKITIGERVEFIGCEAFSSCGLHEIILKAFTPPDAHDLSFEEDAKRNASLFIPKGTKDKYMSSPMWNQFANIIEI